jgi:serine/threonine protein kinase/tetratricopeptide (TPR) repeat protein
VGPPDTISTKLPSATLGPATVAVVGRTARSEGERFQVLHLHARGGLGEVWMAEDVDLNRQVALKEIRSQQADEPQNRARFLQEAEITGRLEHPGIVPVYALGHRADGRPYYVMRFIRGDSLQHAIDRYHGRQPTEPDDGAAVPADPVSGVGPAASGGPSATRGKSAASSPTPTLRQLLGRFVDVCEAVAYAHSRGVLHRDLKPDNVMLGRYGETLVVDWGLAKASGFSATANDPSASTAESLLQVTSGSGTQLGSALGTPGYLSPEQARGAHDELTEATDIYSLGATLYCLLTGRAPIAGRNLLEILEATQSGRFPRPREIRRDIPRPLESITLRAMARAPAARYSTVRELADEVQRYLDDEPILAHRDTIAERSARWVRRHKSGVLTGGVALLLVAIVATVAAVLIARSRDQAVRLANDNAQLAAAETLAREEAQRRQQEAEREFQRAERQQARAKKYYALSIQTVDDFLTNVSEDDRLKAVGLEGLRRDLLVQARDFYDLVNQQAEQGDDPLHEQRANAQQKLGLISHEIGDYPAAIEAYQQALTHLRAMQEDSKDWLSYCTVLNNLGLTYDAAGKRPEAIAKWNELIEQVSQRLATSPADEELIHMQAMAELNLALVLDHRDPPRSLELSRSAIAHAQAALKLSPDDGEFQNTLGLVYNNLANTLLALERVEEAQSHLQQAQQIWENLRENATGWEADYLDDQLALLYLNQSIVAAHHGDNDQGARLIEQGLQLRRRIAAQHPEAVELQTRLADLRQTAAIHYRSLVRYGDSLRQSAAALQVYAELHKAQPEVPGYQASMAELYREHGITQYMMGRMDDALASLQLAITHAQALLDKQPEQYEFRGSRAVGRYYLGLCLVDATELKLAVEALTAAEEDLQWMLQQRPDQPALLNYLSDCQGVLAALWEEGMLDVPETSRSWWQRSRATVDRLLSPELVDQVPASVLRDAQINFAEACTGLDDFAPALQMWDQLLAAEAPHLDFEVGVGKAVTLFQAGQYEAGLEWARKTAVAQSHPAMAFAIARNISMAVTVLEQSDLPADQRNEWTEAYARAAVEVLSLAADKGYFDSPQTVEFLSTDDFLQPLRDRDDFRALVERLK